MKLRVAGAQIPVTRNIESNVKAITRGIEFAAREKARILLTPEGSVSGYTHEFDAAHAAEALARVTGRAKELGVGLALGTCFYEKDGKCYNEARFYTPEGRFLGFHTKTLRCGSMGKPRTGEINHYAARRLRTFDFNGLTVGALICNDMWANPCCTPLPDTHLSQRLSQMGARVIFHAVNGGRGANAWRDLVWWFHSSNLQMRARAGKVWIVTVDSSYPAKWRCSAPSGVVNPRGKWVCAAPPRGQRFFAYTIAL